MLRNEASAAYETDASFLSMTAVVLKDCNEWRGFKPPKAPSVNFQIIKIVKSYKINKDYSF
ncbi:MAG: hypothetical protein EOO43_21420 [Flavobacterium sp.]|nr:MAG: hypothetical protein EOO43_21420 [Flavobacterium sp.]